jgi:hypothetical protein
MVVAMKGIVSIDPLVVTVGPDQLNYGTQPKGALILRRALARRDLFYESPEAHFVSQTDPRLLENWIALNEAQPSHPSSTTHANGSAKHGRILSKHLQFCTQFREFCFPS